MDVASELQKLIAEVKDRVEKPYPEYTVGYLDALVFVLEMVEEDE